MVKRTNNWVYAYQLLLSDNFDEKFFKNTFTEDKITDCLYEFKDSYYWGYLTFMGNYNEGLFFRFSKIVPKNEILVTDFDTKKQKIASLAKSEKHTANSFFVYYPDKKLMLGLYNMNAMRHISAPLNEYLKDKLKSESIECNLIKMPINAEKILGENKFINRVVIVSEKKDIDSIAEENNEDPFSGLDSFTNYRENIIDYKRISKKKQEGIVDKIKNIINSKSASSIKITGDNVNDLDLLGKEMLGFFCRVDCDELENPNFENFKNNVNRIYEKHKNDLLKGF